MDRVRPVLPAHLSGTRPWTNIGRSLVLIEKIRKTFPSSHGLIGGFERAFQFRACRRAHRAAHGEAMN